MLSDILISSSTQFCAKSVNIYFVGRCHHGLASPQTKFGANGFHIQMEDVVC